ncbi:CaiB/BaiF CoA transferase family protein [Paraburkholderia lacunae]|uniref:Carnitine dehydratase n=1 Tax=Paraburkholderia lacunae TaxID=2211104 RepID=A0A370MVI1_9BURK|nr:CaiB/BaiF CoA-transferase family protein [Paraburkholderia lacunae]RDJ97359.1 carnitine dehydratase [Paraburkholderia lacunae]
MKQGPLSGLKVVEFGAIGPVPFCAMMLADMGADVVQLARPRAQLDPNDVMLRGRRIVPLDLKDQQDRETALELVARADILLEGNRPGVMESLGLGPDVCLGRNPRLVYGRMTGWGQEGPLASKAGHDINYISLTGALDAIGNAGGAPVPPLNLVGDYGGGAMFLAFGVLCAQFEARDSGQGQVVDAAMVDGSAMLMSLFCRMYAQGRWTDRRGANMLDGGAPWYTTYQTSDGRYVAVGALEEPFWQELLERLDIAPDTLPSRTDRSGWDTIRNVLAQCFLRKTRDEWAALFSDSDACVSPVLGLREATNHAHVASRGSFIELGGVTQPAPAPRFSRTPAGARPAAFGPDAAAAVFESWGVQRPSSDKRVQGA